MHTSDTNRTIGLALAAAVSLFACGNDRPPDSPSPEGGGDDGGGADGGASDARTSSDGTGLGAAARVTSVSLSGEPGAYTFSVTISSPDLGCTQFADWWEVVAEDETLLYRRILLHSHVDEQPFTRSGGPVTVAADQAVTIRAHMNTSGYGSAAQRGSAQGGFEAFELPEGFAEALESKAPQPEGCDF
jgi:hypothetical protein